MDIFSWCFQLYEDHRDMGRYCGEDTGLTLTTEFNTLFIKFKSDAIKSAKGFEAEYFQVEGISLYL